MNEVAGYLLFPDDERRLIEHLNAEQVLLLRSDLLVDGEPDLASPPVPTELPPLPRVVPGEEGVHSYVFWCSLLGPLQAEGDAPAPTDARERVARQLLQAQTERWRDVIDYKRSPIIRLRRAHWHRSGALLPALLQGQPRVTREWPPELLRLFQRVERWLRSWTTKTNEWDLCPPEGEVRPANVRPYVFYASPAALDWVQKGGRAFAMNRLSGASGA
jgi:hypothetical protein